MNKDILQYLEKYDERIIKLFQEVRNIIISSCKTDIEEKLWAKLPSFYVGEKVVRVIPFMDHVNINASAVNNHRSDLTDYKITPKGMLQLFIGQEIPKDILRTIFIETLGD